jgi:hypothetical protein
MLSVFVFVFVRRKENERSTPMKTLLLAFGLIVMSAVSSMAGPQDSPYLCNVVDSHQSLDNRICS